MRKGPPPGVPETPLNKLQCLSIVYLIFNDIQINYSLAPIFPDLAASYYPIEEVGFWVGFITSIYFGMQIFSSFVWGWLADRYGRRPTLIAGLIGNNIGLIMFGFSTSYMSATVARCVCGLLSGSSTIAKTYLGELTDETNAHKAFGFLGVGYGLALVVGPAMGGWLANPADDWAMFDNGFWQTYPYLLAILTLMAFSMVAFFLAIAFLDESEPWKKANEARNASEFQMDDKANAKTPLRGDYESVEGSDDSQEIEAHFDFPCQFLNDFVPYKARRKLIFYVIFVFFLNVIMYMGYDVMFAVFAEGPRTGGGLGFDPATTGLMMSMLGVSMMVWNVGFYKKVGAKLGTRGTVLFGLFGLLGLYIFFPTLTWVDQNSSSPMSFGTYAFVIIAQAWRAVAGSSSTMASQVLITQVTPPEVLGQVNGYSNAVTAVAKVLGPMAAGAVWTVLQQNDEYTPFIKVAGTYWVFAIVGILPCWAAMQLPKKFTVMTGRVEKPLPGPEDELNA